MAAIQNDINVWFVVNIKKWHMTEAIE